jgi:hypothetical protein
MSRGANGTPHTDTAVVPGRHNHAKLRHRKFKLGPEAGRDVQQATCSRVLARAGYGGANVGDAWATRLYCAGKIQHGGHESSKIPKKKAFSMCAPGTRGLRG